MNRIRERMNKMIKNGCNNRNDDLLMYMKWEIDED